jgi:hypothetical protein
VGVPRVDDLSRANFMLSCSLMTHLGDVRSISPWEWSAEDGINLLSAMGHCSRSAPFYAVSVA